MPLKDAVTEGTQTHAQTPSTKCCSEVDGDEFENGCENPAFIRRDNSSSYEEIPNKYSAGGIPFLKTFGSGECEIETGFDYLTDEVTCDLSGSDYVITEAELHSQPSAHHDDPEEHEYVYPDEILYSLPDNNANSCTNVTHSTDSQECKGCSSKSRIENNKTREGCSKLGKTSATSAPEKVAPIYATVKRANGTVPKSTASEDKLHSNSVSKTEPSNSSHYATSIDTHRTGQIQNTPPQPPPKPVWNGMAGYVAMS